MNMHLGNRGKLMGLFRNNIHIVDRTPNRLKKLRSGYHKISLNDESQWYLCGCGAKREAFERRLGIDFRGHRFTPHNDRFGWWG